MAPAQGFEGFGFIPFALEGHAQCVPSVGGIRHFFDGLREMLNRLIQTALVAQHHAIIQQDLRVARGPGGQCNQKGFSLLI